ncbi:MAG: 50S ribosomal protein L17 [bacterium]|nr:50S ribosomal protein L17 [bacterium]
MNHNRKGRTLGREKAPREALIRNLAQSLILYENVNTTLAKAKEVRPFVEKLITKAKVKSLTTRRTLHRTLSMDSAVNKMLEEIGPRYKDRAGGYTRIIKLGRRLGDGAEIAQIQLVQDVEKKEAPEAKETVKN